MNDRAVSLLEQYDIEVFRTRKGRGAIICDTNQGCLIFKEYSGNENKLAVQNAVLQHITEQGKVPVEALIPTKEGELSVKDNDGIRYILKTYREGRECNIYEETEAAEAVKTLALLHHSMELPREFAQDIPAFSQAGEYEKHNKELKKVRKYLQHRSQKSTFEINLLHTFDYFLDQAYALTEEWEHYREAKERMVSHTGDYTFCHGDFQYHNILRSDRQWFIINFEKCQRDDCIRDLYLFLRKILEKSNWSVNLGRELLAVYEKERPLPAISRIDLYYRLAYPEKFWKIVNFYFNSGKAWIPERNSEKLAKVVQQEKAKQQFLDEVFRKVI